MDKANAEISLFTTHRLSWVLIENVHPEVHLHLDEVHENTSPPGIRFATLYPPVLKWSIKNLTSSDFADIAIRTLKTIINIEQRNIRLRGIGFLEALKWTTNSPEIETGTWSMMRSGSGIEATVALREMIPYAHVLEIDAEGSDDQEGHDLAIRLMKYMCARGVPVQPMEVIQLLWNARMRPQSNTALPR